MTPQEINQAIHDALFEPRYHILKRGLYYRPGACGYTDDPKQAWEVLLDEAKKHECPHDEPVTIRLVPPKDYYHDLNAVHEAVNFLKEVIGTERFRKYADYLKMIVSAKWGVDSYIEATAPQKCDALLKTLKLWKE